MVRMLLVMMLIGEFLLVGWLAGLRPGAIDMPEAWSRAQHAVRMRKGVDEGGQCRTLWRSATSSKTTFPSEGMSHKQARRHWRAVVAAAPGHLHPETLIA